MVAECDRLGEHFSIRKPRPADLPGKSGRLSVAPGDPAEAAATPVAATPARVACRRKPALALPRRSSPEGAVARLLLSEARGPFHPRYRAADSRTGMEWMKIVLVDRFKRPRRFDARGARSLIDIIRAKGQFAGFSGYPHYDRAVVERLQQMLDIAADDHDPRQPVFRAFFRAAIDVAKAPAAADPAPTALYAFRTAGSGSPGFDFKPYANRAGNTFYTLANVRRAGSVERLAVGPDGDRGHGQGEGNHCLDRPHRHREQVLLVPRSPSPVIESAVMISVEKMRTMMSSAKTVTCPKVPMA
jgi:hypothetical protein